MHPVNVFVFLRVLLVSRRGVSMFAMLTGTLPFTVEPFNIKQLHQKMVNGEISSIPSDVSKGKSTSALKSTRASLKKVNVL